MFVGSITIFSRSVPFLLLKIPGLAEAIGEAVVFSAKERTPDVECNLDAQNITKSWEMNENHGNPWEIPRTSDSQFSNYAPEG